MKKKCITLFVSAFILCAHGNMHPMTPINDLGIDMVLLKLPSRSAANWKEISRHTTEQEGMVEFIPSNQRTSSWSELVSIQYFDKSIVKGKMARSIKEAINALQKETLASYEGTKITWNLIELNKSDAIYERILHRSLNNLIPEHDIAKAFLTDAGFHRVAFTRKYKEMSPKEREQCIEILRNSTSLVSAEEAKKHPEALSILDKIKNSLVLGEAFKTWKELQCYSFETGYTVSAHVPPSFDGNYVDECLEITTLPSSGEASIEQLFEGEKKLIRKKSSDPIEFPVLKKTSHEIIYSFCHPKDHLLVTGIVRTFLTDKGYYSICYKRGLPDKLKTEEILQWKEVLEKIEVRNTD